MTSPEIPSTPARLAWAHVRETFREVARASLASWGSTSQAYVEKQLDFALGRFDSGVDFVRYFELPGHSLAAPPHDLLDIGTGTGGLAFAFANCLAYRVSSMDIGQNRILRQVARATGLPVRYALASGHALPYRAESFDVVLLIETLEHVPRPRLLCSEIVRILRPAGVCVISTPARLKYVLDRDPHYGVRFLAGFPNAFQRFVVDRILRRRIVSPDGRSWPAYDVEHLYWHVREIARLFPVTTTVEPLFSRPPAGGPPLSREWWRRRFRNFLFDHVVVHKAATGRKA